MCASQNIELLDAAPSTRPIFIFTLPVSHWFPSNRPPQSEHCDLTNSCVFNMSLKWGNETQKNKVVATTYVPIAIIFILPDPFTTSQVDLDLVAEVAEVRAKSQSNSSVIMVWSSVGEVAESLSCQTGLKFTAGPMQSFSCQKGLKFTVVHTELVMPKGTVAHCRTN